MREDHHRAQRRAARSLAAFSARAGIAAEHVEIDPGGRAEGKAGAMGVQCDGLVASDPTGRFR